MKSVVYEIRTISDFVVCQFVDLDILLRYLKTYYSHLTNYKIVKITTTIEEEEITCEVSRNPEAGTPGSTL